MVIIALIVFAQPVFAEPIVETIPDGPYAEPELQGRSILVLLQHPQPALLGPNALEIQRDRPRDTYLDTWGRPAIWRLIGRTQEARQRVTASGADRSAKDVFDDLVTRFDFVGTTVESIADFDARSNWSIHDINRSDFIGHESGKWLDDRLVRRLFYRSNVDSIMSIRYTYFMAPGLSQIRLVVKLRMYSRAERDARYYVMTLKRRYEYLSPVHVNSRRNWWNGERQAFKRAIEYDYVVRTERNPQNEPAYRQDRKEAEAELRRSPDYVLLPDGMLEAWSPDDLHKALRLAAERMANMIGTDLSRLPANERVDGRKLTITGLQLDGDPKRMRARVFLRDGQNTVYQTGGGDLYSIPTAN